MFLNAISGWLLFTKELLENAPHPLIASETGANFEMIWKHYR
jgi:hypothetical protein